MGAPKIKVSAREQASHAHRQLRRLKGQSRTRPVYITILQDETTKRVIAAGENAEVLRAAYPEHLGAETLDVEMRFS